jgi:hypothetical protein
MSENTTGTNGTNGTKINLTNSKTLWSFGLALIFIISRILLVNKGIAISDSLEASLIEILSFIFSFFGIYGFRDALRNIESDIEGIRIPLKESKTLWGFGAASVSQILRILLVSTGVVNSTLPVIILHIISFLFSFDGIYGLRDALRKIIIRYKNKNINSSFGIRIRPLQ